MMGLRSEIDSELRQKSLISANPGGGTLCSCRSACQPVMVPSDSPRHFAASAREQSVRSRRSCTTPQRRRIRSRSCCDSSGHASPAACGVLDSAKAGVSDFSTGVGAYSVPGKECQKFLRMWYDSNKQKFRTNGPPKKQTVPRGYEIIRGEAWVLRVPRWSRTAEGKESSREKDRRFVSRAYQKRPDLASGLFCVCFAPRAIGHAYG